MRKFFASFAALPVLLSMAISGPAIAENVLRWASVGGAGTFDPHSFDENPTENQQWQVYESLLDNGSNLEIVPQLAVSWKLLDPLTWEFALREDVRFHDGTPFTAEDVVFSLERARADTSQMASYVANVLEARALDRHTVRITTKVPAPALPMELRSLPMILSKTWAQAHGVTAPADFGAGERTYATRHANGTGPFMLEEFEPDGRVVMIRDPDWWGLEAYPHNVDRIVFTPVADPDQRLAMLLAGDIDFLLDPPFDALGEIERHPDLKLEQTTELRTVFLGLDQASPELRSSEVRGTNPFQDRRVRQAMYQAIDIEAIQKDVMHGLSLPAGMLIPPGVNGYDPKLDQRLPRDLAAARALLAAAGYPQGFGVTLDCPNNRYINDEAICRAVASDLGEIGIRVTVDAVPKALHFPKIFNRKTDFYLLGWSETSLDSQNVFLTFFHSRGSPWSAAGYADPRVDELIDTIGRALLTYGRDALIEEVWKAVLNDIVYLPLHHQVIVWATRDNLDVPVDPFNRPIFREARFK